MAFFEELWVDAIEKLVSESLDEQEETTVDNLGVHGISNAFKRFRTLATDAQAVELRSRLDSWKLRCLHGSVGTLVSDKTERGSRSKPTLQVRLARVLQALPDLFSILYSLAEVVSNELSQETTLNASELELVQDNLVDSWVTKLVGSLVVLYSSWKLHPKRLLALDPKRVAVTSTLDVSAERVYGVLHEFVLPTMERFCVNQRLKHLAIAYIVGASLPDMDPVDIHRYSSIQKINDCWPGHRRETMLHLICRFARTPITSITKIALGVVLANGADETLRNAQEQTAFEVADSLKHEQLCSILDQHQSTQAIQRRIVQLRPEDVRGPCRIITERDIQDAEEQLLLLQQDIFASEIGFTKSLVTVGNILGCLGDVQGWLDEQYGPIDHNTGDEELSLPSPGETSAAADDDSSDKNSTFTSDEDDSGEGSESSGSSESGTSRY